MQRPFRPIDAVTAAALLARLSGIIAGIRHKWNRREREARR
jgi:hypothetical protein